jgi:hypothetical protein
VRVTGQVLPVLEHAGWQVETVWLDRGDGLHEWIEIRHGDAVEYARTRADLFQFLQRHGLRYGDFTEVQVEDGCE